eukprot:COSAG01_NODE_4148_length_5295_cov_7.400115_7_plen_96_part_00
MKTFFKKVCFKKWGGAESWAKISLEFIVIDDLVSHLLFAGVAKVIQDNRITVRVQVLRMHTNARLSQRVLLPPTSLAPLDFVGRWHPWAKKNKTL